MKNIILLFLTGIIFCFLQSFGEALIGIFIITASHAHDVNSGGIIMFAMMRIIMTVPFYLIIFTLTDLTNKLRVPASVIALIINIGVIVYFYNRGMIHNNTKIYLVASLITSGILMYFDRQNRIKEFLKNRI